MWHYAIEKMVNGYTLFILFYSAIVFLAYLTLTVSSVHRLRKFITLVKTDITGFSYYTKPISLLVPAYNEQETIRESLYSLLQLDYPEYEVIVINDGSTDGTFDALVKEFSLEAVNIDYDEKLSTEKVKGVYRSTLHPNLLIVDKENGGKSDSLNTGINFSSYPLFCAVDADCIMEEDALFRIINPYLKYENVIAVGGMIRPSNGSKVAKGRMEEQHLPKKWMERFQIVEYLRAFILSRIGFQNLNAVMIISGAFGLFDKAVVLKAGGYHKTIGEDMELVLRMQEYMIENGKSYKIDFTSDAVCWTQAPNKYRDLAGQRRRWHCGLIDSLWSHKRMLFNPKFGRIGMFSMPFYVGIELLGPLFEVTGYLFFIVAWVSGVLSPLAIYLFLLAYTMGLFFSLVAILYDQLAYHRYTSVREIVLLIVSAILEATFYRMITVFWRTKAFFVYRKSKGNWGSIQRESFTKPEWEETMGGMDGISGKMEK